MSSIFYVFRKTVKNAFFEMFHHPTKLISYLFVAILILSSIGNFLFGAKPGLSSVGGQDFIDIGLLHGIFLAVAMFIGIPTILMGLSSGTTLFSMSDVNMMFVSPITPKKMLVYGILRKAGAVLFFFFVFLVYGNMTKEIFGITNYQSVMLILGLAVFMLVCQLISMLCYSVSNSNTTRIMAIKIGLFACVASVVVFVLYGVYINGIRFDSITTALKSPVLEYIPLFGWIKGLTFALMELDVTKIAVFGTLNLLVILLSVLFFAKVNTDYYEDVLQNTESTYEMRQAMMQGKLMERPNIFTKKTKVTDTGINRGNGASTFLFKHIRELKRRSRLIFLNNFSVIFSIIATGVALLLTNVPDDDGSIMSPNIAMAIILALGVYMQFFFSMIGEWNKELMKPYIYLVPASAFKKMLFASSTCLIKPLIDGLLAFTVAGIAIKANPLTILLCIITYTTFGFVYTSSNILVERFVGGVNSKGVVIFIYIVVLGIIFAPGVAGAVLVMAMFGSAIPLALSTLPMIIWNTVVSIGIYMICKETLHDMECNF